MLLLLSALLSPATTYGQANSPARVLVGVVRDTSGNSIPYAYVYERTSGSWVIADVSGAFRLARVPPQRSFIVGARRIGYLPSEVSVDSAAAGESVVISLRSIPAALSQVVVTARTGDYDEGLDEVGYYRRMVLGTGGSFITPREIERRNPLRVSYLFGTVPGVRVREFGNRGEQGSVPLGRGGQCPLGLVIDNQRFEYKAPSLAAVQRRMVGMVGGVTIQGGIMNDRATTGTDSFDDMVPVRMVKAIEVYPTATSVPNVFQHHVANACGLVIVWTKMR